MRALVLALALAGCGSVPPSPACTLDDGAVDTCVAYSVGAGFVVAVRRGHEAWDVNGPTRAAAGVRFPGPATLQYNAPDGTSCHAANGGANWTNDGERFDLFIVSTCGGTHSIDVPSSRLR